MTGLGLILLTVKRRPPLCSNSAVLSNKGNFSAYQVKTTTTDQLPVFLRQPSSQSLGSSMKSTSTMDHGRNIKHSSYLTSVFC
jgi:hypothetical protein